MKLLIIGGTGTISREITKQSIEAGHNVTLFNRGNHSDIDFLKHAEVIFGDRTIDGELKEKLKGKSFDCVIDMISFSKKDAETTLSVFDGKTSHIIFTSSVAAYKQPSHSLPIKENTTSLRTDTEFAYGFGKAEMERYITANKTETPITIIRPSLTFGIGSKSIGVLRQNSNIVHRIRRGEPLIMFGDGTIPNTFTFAPDLAKAYLLVLMNSKTYGESFHITSGITNIWQDLYSVIGEIVGQKPKFIYAPSEMLNDIDPKVFAHLQLEKKFFSVYDCTKFRETVPEWKPNFNLKSGMEMIYSWWEKEGMPFDKKKNELESLLCNRINNFTEQLRNEYMSLKNS